MTVGNLQDIIEKIQEVSASGNSNQVTLTKIIKYINSYYLYDLPNEFRNLKLKDVYTFNTIQNVDTYPFDFEHWETVEAPAFSNKAPMSLYQDKTQFYTYNWYSQQNQNIAVADGTAGPYSFTTQSSPILASVNNNPITDTQLSNTQIFPAGYPPTFREPNISRIQNILISANTATSSLHVTDDGAGNLIGDCLAGGTVDYQTGIVANLVFTQAVPSGNNITMQYLQAVQGQPFTMLFFQDQFVVRPVPDQAYTIEVTAYRRPSQALLGTVSLESPNLNGRPEQYDWWELIVFGVAKKLYQDRLDDVGADLMQKYHDEKLSQCNTRSYAQLGSRCMATIFRDETTSQIGYNYGRTTRY
jgi:hypothetical protein